MAGFWVIALIYCVYFIRYTECYDEGAVRLVDGPSPLMGTVEVLYRDRWLRVSVDGFGDIEATIVCRQLGLNNVGSAYRSKPNSEDVITVSCNGTEENLASCLPRDHEDYGMGIGAGVVCSDVRLVSGRSGATVGAVEVYREGEWLPVLDDTWNNTDASVVCRQLGITNPVSRAFTTDAIPELDYSSSSLPNESARNVSRPSVCDVTCKGTEASLSDCSSDDWKSVECQHDQFANVSCERILRLVSDDGHPNEGRVEVFLYGTWGSICDDRWDDVDATVVCRELGHGKYGTAVHESFYGKGRGLIVMTNVNCIGNEGSIFECDHVSLNGFSDICSTSEIAGIVCSDSAVTEPTVDKDENSTWLNNSGLLNLILAAAVIIMCIGLLVAVVYLTFLVKRKLNIQSEMIPVSESVKHTKSPADSSKP